MLRARATGIAGQAAWAGARSVVQAGKLIPGQVIVIGASIQKSAYATAVAISWLGLMGYQAYDGYLRPRPAVQETTDLAEPWDVTYLLRVGSEPCGFLAERLYLNDASTGWTREESFFVNEHAFGDGLLGTALVGVRPGGGLDSLLLRVHSSAGALVIEAKRDEDELRVSARRDGQALLDDVAIPVPESSGLRLDLPLLGAERLPDGHRELALPSAPGVDVRPLTLSVDPVPGAAAGGADRPRVVSVRTQDGTWLRLELDAAGHLRRATSSTDLTLESTSRRILARFLSEREKLMDRLGSQRQRDQKAGTP